MLRMLVVPGQLVDDPLPVYEWMGLAHGKRTRLDFEHDGWSRPSSSLTAGWAEEHGTGLATRGLVHACLSSRSL